MIFTSKNRSFFCSAKSAHIFTICMLVLAITLSLKVKGKHAKGLKDAKGTSTYETIETASVHENFAYTGVGHQFVVLNIAISNAPAEVAAISISEGKVMDVHVVQQKAYVAAGGAGFRVMDISEPMSPKEIGFVNTPGYAEGVTVLGYNAYVADGGAGLRVIDISEPAEPREVEVGYE